MDSFDCQFFFHSKLSKFTTSLHPKGELKGPGRAPFRESLKINRATLFAKLLFENKLALLRDFFHTIIKVTANGVVEFPVVRRWRLEKPALLLVLQFFTKEMDSFSC